MFGLLKVGVSVMAPSLKVLKQACPFVDDCIRVLHGIFVVFDGVAAAMMPLEGCHDGGPHDKSKASNGGRN
eukprot:m.200507 g.200507  ORF g.200507 m.200507 type:complete len:71 (+) comp25206_c0_seq5:89-301(+)